MNRFILWCTLAFVALMVVVPAVQLLTGDKIEDFFRLGPDLKGGDRLVYSVEKAGMTGGNKDESASVDTEQLITVLSKRVDPTNTKNYIIRSLGKGKLEIVIPAGAGGDDETGAREVQTVESLVRRNGLLRFMILADPETVRQLSKGRTHESICQDRLQDKEPPAGFAWMPLQYNSRTDWADAADFLGLPKGMTREAVVQAGSFTNDAQNVVFVILPTDETPETQAKAAAGKKSEVADIEVLVRTDTPVVEGRHFASTRKGTNNSGQPIVVFSMVNDAQVQGYLGTLTRDNVGKRMGIVLDNRLQSAPNIKSELRDGGIIEGYKTPAERDQVLAVIQSGTLDVSLTLIAKEHVGPELGADNIQHGKIATAISFCVVIAFMAGYYLLAGIIADLAVIANMLIIVVIMCWMQGTWTLPGIAGLVLTVGMAVDANVLIFERMREELARGSSVRLAVRSGYARALPAIVDGNLTTLITAIILAWVGSPDVRGFAVVLIIGLVTSMFTAILFTRALFELLISAGLLRQIRMLQLFKTSNIRFTKLMPVAFTISLIAVVTSLVLAFASGKSSLAMEFNGGTQVELNLKNPGLPIEEVRTRLATLDEGLLVGVVKLESAKDLASVRATVAQSPALAKAVVTPVSELNADGLTTDFYVQVFNLDEATAKKAVAEALRPVNAEHLEVQNVSSLGYGYGNALVQTLELGADDRAGDQKQAKPQRYVIQVLNTNDTQVRESIASKFRAELEDSGRIEVAPLNGRILSQDDVLAMQRQAGASASPDSKFIQPDYRKYLGAYEAQITLTGRSATREEIENRVRRFLEERKPDKATMTREIKVSGPEDPERPGQYRSFTITVLGDRMTRASADVAKEAAEQWNANLSLAISDARPLGSNKVDSRIGQDAQFRALIAMILSLLGIIVYVWFRFAQVSYGFASVLALFHDVCVALGLVIVFSWIGRGVPFIGEMKIDLPMIGAFLTLIGYSINDTIVIFDRIRENRGRFGELSEAVINTSINQTLSRTILTSLTVFFVVAVLYFFGGTQSTIHGFSFVMTVGVIVGSYSTIFIAAPMLLWLRRGKVQVSGGNPVAGQ
jgi:SecD/SecF fusion protein